MNRQQMRQQLDPKTFKKHSSVMKAHASNVIVTGDRDKTNTGFRVPGTSCANFETYYEYIADGQISDHVIHPKKFRSVRVLSGQGVALLTKDGVTKSLTLIPGDEVSFHPGISFQISSSPKLHLELFVTQAYKYEAALETISKSETEALLDDGALASVSRADAISRGQVRAVGDIPPRRPRGKQKAAQQQTKRLVGLGRYKDVTPAALAPLEPEVISAMPTYGADSD